MKTMKKLFVSAFKIAVLVVFVLGVAVFMMYVGDAIGADGDTVCVQNRKIVPCDEPAEQSLGIFYGVVSERKIGRRDELTLTAWKSLDSFVSVSTLRPMVYKLIPVPLKTSPCRYDTEITCWEISYHKNSSVKCTSE
ncbi:MAG: hypothetical protein GY841_16375 [FCB group bacterium]|nr:hypothetical protein [FCB group bacterium]